MKHTFETAIADHIAAYQFMTPPAHTKPAIQRTLSDNEKAVFTEAKYKHPTYDYFSMKEGDVWQCGRSIWFDSTVDLTVYDDDGESADDVVGTLALAFPAWH